jgi:hypothetical protein
MTFSTRQGLICGMHFFVGNNWGKSPDDQFQTTSVFLRHMHAQFEHKIGEGVTDDFSHSAGPHLLYTVLFRQRVPQKNGTGRFGQGRTVCAAGMRTSADKNTQHRGDDLSTRRGLSRSLQISVQHTENMGKREVKAFTTSHSLVCGRQNSTRQISWECIFAKIRNVAPLACNRTKSRE